MPFISLGLRRAAAKLLMPKAFKAGMSASGFRQLLRGKGLQYQWQTLLRDWRTTLNIEAKKDAIKFVRKDRVPSPMLFPEVDYKYSQEYIYFANTWSRTHPEAPITEQMVTYTSDIPLSAREVEEEITVDWPEWGSPKESMLEKVEVTEFLRTTYRVPTGT
ncbi:unnamed protein product [marine sediment metagenome]|uniref:Uncharacterized protein n=1 Tax=marine sediment metagenome TaxID=412755 RepID=X1Q862_9ZZZZ